MQNSSYKHRYSEIGLAELLQALKLLQPTDAEAFASIAETLGLKWQKAKEDIVDELPFTPGQSDNPSSVTTQSITPEIKKSDPLPEPVRPIDSQVTLLKPVDRQMPFFDVLFNNPALKSVEKLKPTNIALHLKSPRHQPLLRNKWFRGIMSAILATPIDSRDLDWRILNNHLTDGHPLGKLPLQQRPTLRRGVILLLDRSDSMQPFWHDEKELLNQLQRLLGPRKVLTWWVEVDRWSSIEFQIRWHSPPPQQFPRETPLLVVSDFGCRGEPSGDGSLELTPWLPVLDLARSNNCPVTALIPAPEAFWPEMLKQLIPFIFTWDHHTSIQTVRRSRPRIR
jgi:hypothetical protein